MNTHIVLSRRAENCSLVVFKRTFETKDIINATTATVVCTPDVTLEDQTVLIDRSVKSVGLSLVCFTGRRDVQCKLDIKLTSDACN